MTINTATFATKVTSNTKLTYIILSLIALVILMGVIFTYNGRVAEHDKQYINIAGELRLLSQRIVKHAAETARADIEAFPKLKLARERSDELINKLQNGDHDTGMPASPVEASLEFNQIKTEWEQLNANATVALSAEATTRMIKEFIRALSDILPQVVNASDDIADQLLKAGASPRQIQLAAHQALLAQRINHNLLKMLQGGQETNEITASISADVKALNKIIDGLLHGEGDYGSAKVTLGPAIAKLNQVNVLNRSIAEISGRILERAPELFKAQVASNNIFKMSDQILETSNHLVQAYVDLSQSGTRQAFNFAGYVVALAAIVALVLLAVTLVHESRKRIEESTAVNETNQNAILRLLDEISVLAEGDLTTSATVNDDITGAIADRINFIIDALRKLVNTINDTVVQVSSAATETRATAAHLADATDHQAHQISASVTAINEMATSIQHVSSNAAKATEVTSNAVQIAQNGVKAVHNTIHGMETIREQIQETSKRIKRLGESSLEIGEIVELINDLTDQTNILALNAAIQAAMAGEAGRGFAVVADEVQRLAERANDATSQIEALVKTIQNDTSEAITSMEKSTHEVVNGTKLAQAAGEALVEIESVSHELDEMMRNISAAAKQQTSVANNISETMNVIQDLTTQTSTGTNQTAASINNLADLANELRESVSGFKLPSN
ncbi:MAG: methyl-accepting chemotaxis protein [Pseudomonadota bacterium]